MIYCRNLGFCYLIMTIQPFLLSGQSNEGLNKVYDWFDSIAGMDVSGLYNGTSYQNDFIVLNEKHQFFGSSDFTPCFLEYDGQEHYEVPAKYDLQNDELIITPRNTLGSLPLNLVKSKVRNFRLLERKFVHLSPLYFNLTQDLGFCEVILENAYFGLYKKYVKKGKEVSKEGKVFHEFNSGHSFHLHMDGNLYKLRNKQTLTQLFPDRKAAINDYYRNYRQMRLSKRDEFMVSLLAHLNELMSSAPISSK